MTNMKTLESENFINKIYYKNGIKNVHYTFEELQIKGNLFRTDLIWFEGLNDWIKVSEIDELSKIALNTPPLTLKEKNFIIFKKTLKPSLLFYILFSIILGVFAGLLEKYQYEIFFVEVNANSLEYQKEDIVSQNVYSTTEPSFYNYSNIHQDEIYATNDDGTKFTRWSSYIPERGIDQEQVSYNASHKFFFRPYKAIIKHTNLSKDERNNIGLLLFNFSLSALATNILLLPFLLFFNLKKIKKTYKF